MDCRVHDLFFGRFRSGEFFDDTALPCDKNAIGQAQNLRQVGRYDNNRDTLRGKRADEIVDLLNCADIHTPGRLIEEHDLWILNEGFRA